MLISSNNLGNEYHLRTFALTEGLDGALVAHGNLATLHHQRKARVDAFLGFFLTEKQTKKKLQNHPQISR